MGNFNRGDRRSAGSGFNRGSGGFGGGRSFGGEKSFGGGSRFPSRDGGRDGGRPPMHKAICSECGANCELPFRPTGDRPVFCSSCFDKQQGGARAARPNRFTGERHERTERSRFEDRQMHEAICAKCSKPCHVPFRPMAGKPVFCDNCFEKGGNVGKDSGEVMAQIKMLNIKIDKLMKFLAPNLAVEEKAEKIEKSEIKKELKKEDKGISFEDVVVKEDKPKAKTKAVAKKVVAKKKK
ncbi:MAG TPA: hypothetical protein PLV72_01225 [Candidatus Magasanikbacteria bacterium]|nr:hypothetical protein [Candidatus Magasanikbacteria bacterium]